MIFLFCIYNHRLNVPSNLRYLLLKIFSTHLVCIESYSGSLAQRISRKRKLTVSKKVVFFELLPFIAFIIFFSCIAAMLKMLFIVASRNVL
jgi:hypothetical protein